MAAPAELPPVLSITGRASSSSPEIDYSSLEVFEVSRSTENKPSPLAEDCDWVSVGVSGVGHKGDGTQVYGYCDVTLEMKKPNGIVLLFGNKIKEMVHCVYSSEEPKTWHLFPKKEGASACGKRIRWCVERSNGWGGNGEVEIRYQILDRDKIAGMTKSAKKQS